MKERVAFGLSMIVVMAACGSTTASPPAPGARDGDGGADAATSTRVGVPPSTTPVSSSTWCMKEAHDFCADFDGDAEPWGFDQVLKGRSPIKDEYGITASEASAPSAFYAKGDALPRPDGGPDPLAPSSGTLLIKDLNPTQSTKARIAFDLRVTSVDDMIDFVELSGRKNGGANIAFNVWGHIGPNGTWLSAANGPVPKFPPIPQGRFVHVEIAIDDHGGEAAGVVTLSFDGEVVGTAPLSGRLVDASETTLFLNHTRTAPAGAYEVAYDNVTFDYL